MVVEIEGGDRPLHVVVQADGYSASPSERVRSPEAREVALGGTVVDRDDTRAFWVAWKASASEEA